MSDSRQEAREGVRLLFNSRLQESEALFLAKSDSDPLASLGMGLVYFLQAVLSFDQQVISLALDKLSKAHHLATPLATGGAEGFVSNLFFKPKSNEQTIANDLICADSLAMSALLQLLQESYLASMKGALNLRSSNNLYKQAQEYLLKNPMPAGKDPLDLEDGVGFGIGMFNLVLSLLPEKVVAVAEHFGFSGDRALAMKLLKSCHENGGLRSPLASLLLLTYHTVLASFFSLPDASSEEADVILKTALERYPEGALFLWMGGKAERTKGNMAGAIHQYEEALKAQKNAEAEAKEQGKGSKQFNELCYYEIAWCQLLSQKYEESHKHFTHLMNESAWSKCSNAYFAAVSLLEQGKAAEATALFSVIPKLLSEVSSKNELESFVSHRVKRYLEKKKALPETSRLIQPGLELIYLWNGFVELKGNARDIIAKIEGFQEEVHKEYYSEEDRSILTLIKTAALRAEGKTEEVKATLEKLLTDSHPKDSYVAPFARYDLALIHLDLGNLEEAEKLAKAAKHSPSGYDFETRLHFRISSTLDYLHQKKKASKH